MSKYTRRSFVKIASLSATALSMPSIAFGALPRVVVIGGGAGGATAAKYIAKDSKGKVDVTLIEASKRYYTCFFSNLYLGDFRNYGSIGHNYYGLAVNRGVNVVHEWAKSIQNATCLEIRNSSSIIKEQSQRHEKGWNICYGTTTKSISLSTRTV